MIQKKRFWLAVTLAAVVCICSADADDVAEKLRNDPFVKQHFGWKMALCQHPMYLLIDEDRGVPIVGERVPPWGSPNAADYVKRVARNLDALEKFGQVKLNYQFSGWAMAQIAERFPKVTDKMRKLYRAGRLDFIGGTFSQPHLHTLGAESNWRQLEFGKQIFRQLFDKDIKVYARQETGLHEQLVQLLKLQGYDFMTIPSFPWVVEISKGPFEIVGCEHGFGPIAGDEFINATALDGSSLPLYFFTHERSTAWTKQLSRDLFSGPPIWISFPDLVEIGQGTVDKYGPLFKIVLLEKALRQRFAQVPPRATGTVRSYWSYTEGVWAEELLRRNKAAEEAAVLAECICSMGKLAGLSVDKSDELKQIWQTILKYQHHDINWIEVTDLRRKAINRLDGVIEKTRQIAADVAGRLVEQDKDSAAVFNSYPKRRNCLVELEDGISPAGDSAFQKFAGRCFGFVDTPAGGFRSLPLSKQSCPASVPAPLPDTIVTGKYTIELSDAGLFKQITTVAGRKLLRTGKYLGGEIRALISGKWVDNRKADCKFYTGNVAYILQRNSALGRIPVHETYFFFRDQPFIKAQIEFDFSGNDVGLFWLDDTKINVYYPTAGSEVYNDIPFGYVRALENRPIFATNWLYCGGLVYINRGTVKHWVTDGLIANVLAWGGNRFSNRTHWGWTSRSQYDIRLYSRQKIDYYLIPAGSFDGNRIVRDTAAITTPVFVTNGRGEKSFYKIKNNDLVMTSLTEKDNELLVRGYKLPSAKKSAYHDWQIFNEPLENIR